MCFPIINVSVMCVCVFVCVCVCWGRGGGGIHQPLKTWMLQSPGYVQLHGFPLNLLCYYMYELQRTGDNFVLGNESKN